MSRLEFRTKNQTQAAVESLYKDFERRIVSSPPGQCPVDMTASFLKLCHAQTCGKCVPCRIGLGQLGEMMDQVLDLGQDPDKDLLVLMKKTATAVRDTADCAIGTEAAQMLLRALDGFKEDFDSHMHYSRCSDDVAKSKEPVPCVGLCPAGVDIPGYVGLVLDGKYNDAVRLIRKDNPFPAVCALICEHPCEARCRRNLIDSPVNIRGLKRFAIDNCTHIEPPKKYEKTGNRVAVIGGGPSGLSAAYYLALMGHEVTIFERRKHLGGMLRYGIPSYRLPRERLDFDINAVLELGVEVMLGCDIDDVETIKTIKDEYDAVYISIGAHTHKTIGIDGEYARGVISAVEMLRGIGDGNMPDFLGKEVVVIGGGNVAMDVARTAKRLGARNVSIVYRRRREDMTALHEEIDGAVAEGCELKILLAPGAIEYNEDSQVTALIAKPQIVGEADSSGRPRPLDAKGEPTRRMACDIVVSAIGQASEVKNFEKYGIPVKLGTIKTQSSSEIQNIPGVYAGGDCVTGPSTVINAIAAGKVAAANIDNYLGYEHEIKTEVKVPRPMPLDKKPCGRADLRLRYVVDRVPDFEGIEIGMSREEAVQESLRCLRCDYNGFGAFRGGREVKW